MITLTFQKTNNQETVMNHKRESLGQLFQNTIRKARRILSLNLNMEIHQVQHVLALYFPQEITLEEVIVFALKMKKKASPARLKNCCRTISSFNSKHLQNFYAIQDLLSSRTICSTSSVPKLKTSGSRFRFERHLLYLRLKTNTWVKY